MFDNAHKSIIKSFKMQLPALSYGAHHTRRLAMNKDQLEGSVKDVGGVIQEKAGKLLGSREQQAKGIAKQIDGTAQKMVGDAKEALKEIKKRHGDA